MLTPEQKAKYLRNRGAGCPFCGCPDIEGDQFDYEGDTVAQRIRCLECEKAWDDVYTLTDVEAVDEGASPSAIVDSNDPSLTYDTVELKNGGCLEWDDGTIRYVDCDGNTEGVWEPADDDYETYKSQYFPNHPVKPDDDHEADVEA